MHETCCCNYSLGELRLAFANLLWLAWIARMHRRPCTARMHMQRWSGSSNKRLEARQMSGPLLSSISSGHPMNFNCVYLGTLHLPTGCNCCTLLLFVYSDCDCSQYTLRLSTLSIHTIRHSTMAEVISIVGLVGSVISIIDAIAETYKLAKDAEKLPEAFAVVNERIPILHETLALIETSYRGSEDEPAIRQTLSTCKSNAEDLSYIFGEVCSVQGDSVFQRYRRALKSLKPGRGDKVETLFRKILDTLLALQAFHVFKNLIPVERLKFAIEELDRVDPSIADGMNTTINSSGTGAMFHNGWGDLSVRQQIGDGGYQAETINFNTPGKASRSNLSPPAICSLRLYSGFPSLNLPIAEVLLLLLLREILSFRLGPTGGCGYHS